MIRLWISTWSTNILHRLDVARHPRDDRAGRVGVEEAEAQPLELVVDLAAQVDDQLLLDQDVDRDVVDVVEDRPADGQGEDEAAEERQDAASGGQASGIAQMQPDSPDSGACWTLCRM